MKRRLVLAGLTAAGAAVLSGCDGDTGPLPPLSLATGESLGVYHPLGRAFARAMRLRWRATGRVTAGSVQNLEWLRDHRCRLAFSTVDVAGQALSGLGSFPTDVGVRALSRLYSDYVHVVVAGTVTDDIDGLAGRRVSTGAPGSGTEVVASRIMAAAGITVRGFERHRLGLADSVHALRAGIIDAFFFSGGLPTPGIGQLFQSGLLGVRLLNVGRYLEPLQSQYGEVYDPGWIPNSVYGCPSVDTVSIANVLAASPTMDEDTAYELTSLLYASKSQLGKAHREGLQLDPHTGLATYPLHLHSGAERFFREQKDA